MEEVITEIKREAVSADKLLSTSNKEMHINAKDAQMKALYSASGVGDGRRGSAMHKPGVRRPREQRGEEAEGGFASKLIGVHRITKVVKGGRTLRFNAVVVVGNKNGIIAVGSGKAREVSEAIKKAEGDAKKNFQNIAIDKTTIPHKAIGKFGSSKVLLLPSKEGSGIIAGGSVKTVLELAGYRDVTGKCYGSTNGTNVVKATLRAITNMRSREEVARLRDKSVEEI